MSTRDQLVAAHDAVRAELGDEPSYLRHALGEAERAYDIRFPAGAPEVADEPGPNPYQAEPEDETAAEIEAEEEVLDNAEAAESEAKAEAKDAVRPKRR